MPCRRAALLALLIGALLVPGLALAQPTELFISEYIEGSSNNKAIEIYNGTAAAVNLTAGNYVVEMYFNGSATATLTISLTGTVAAGDVWVVAHGSASPTILAQADQTNSSGWYNGDDAVVLRKGGAGGTIVDVIGQVGSDPGTEWGTGNQSTADNTIRRKAAVCQGDTNAGDAFNPATEWDGFANDTFGGLGSHTATCSGVTTLSINDVSLAESGGTMFFTVSLSAPAGPGGVTFDIATADNTATVANNDYEAKSLTGQTIPAGSSTYAFSVTINDDPTPEPNETFFVNVTNVTGATVLDGQGTGTINNDDVSLTPIHDIQGPGGSSPIVGATVTTRGVVTGVKSNGFFIQEPDATVDADPATSEGILVFTSSAPPAAAVVGAYVQVTGTVAEFVPSADPFQPPLTELTGPTVVALGGTPPPMPAPVPLSTTFPDPAGPHDQLERLEGMRVQVASLTVVGPTLGTLSESNANSTSTGVFYGVVTGVARPFREPGIQAPDPAPAGSIPPIPRFDSNPERIRVDSDALGAASLDLGTGAVVTGLVGPLDYTFRTYTILPETTPTVTGGPTPTAVTPANGTELTVVSYNLQRFYDTANDPSTSDVVLTAAAYDKRLGKASLAIRDFLRMPDILGVVEAENLSVLEDLAARISSDAAAASQPDPQYVAYLSEGNDVGGIDVGFLVKTAPVAGSTPRVEVVAVTQEGKDTMWLDPSDNAMHLLNDRPSLVLEAVVHDAGGGSFPLTVINNHLRSLNGSNSPEPDGLTTEGDRVRRKRLAQAEFVANLVQARQVADPAERIVLVGDFNAFEFNDGLGDSMGVIQGTPAPDNETAVPGDGVDLVNPDLDNLFDTTPPADRYSYIFDGNAQSLDHVLVNQAMIDATVARRVEHPRINADFPDVARSTAGTAVRLSDHDPIVAYFQVSAFGEADLSMDKSAGAVLSVNAGGTIAYTIDVANEDASQDATDVAWNDTLPAGTTFVSFTAPAGWSCTTPAVGAGGTISCSAATLAAATTASFDLVVLVDAGVAHGTSISNTAQITGSSTADPFPANNQDTATVTVQVTTDYSVTITDSPDPVAPGATLTYTIQVANAGPGSVANLALGDALAPGTTFLSLAAPAGWSCATPAVGAGGTVSCSIASFGPGTATFTLAVQVGASAPLGGTLTNTATVAADTADADTGDTTAMATTTVLAPAMVTATKTVSGSTFPGGVVTYTIVLTNNGPSAQQDNPGDELTDVLPASLTLISANATSGTAATSGNTVTWNGSIPAGGSVTVTIQAGIALSATVGTTITNQGTIAYDADGNGTNESSGTTDDPALGSAGDPTAFVVAAAAIDIPSLDDIGRLLLVLLLATAGAMVLKRRALLS